MIFPIMLWVRGSHWQDCSTVTGAVDKCRARRGGTNSHAEPWGPTLTNRFIVAFGAGRDNYQLAVALKERSLLEILVTTPHTFWGASLLPSRLRRKLEKPLHATLEPADLAVCAEVLPIEAFVVLARRLRLLGKASQANSVKDVLLSQCVLREAKHRDAHLFLYSQYAMAAFRAPELKGRLKGMFVFHPHDLSVGEIYRTDLTRFPQVRLSAEVELMREQRRYQHDEWRYADHIVCASTFTKETLVKQGADPSLIAVIPYGADITSRLVQKPDDNICRFLFVGQGVQRKGLHHLLSVWSKIDPRSATLDIVCSSCDPGIRTMAVPDSVTWRPFMSRAALNQAFLRSDVFVMPSLVEGFGLVYMEALAAGCYCIGTRNTGLPDLNCDTEQAAVIEAGDLDALESAICLALDKKRNRALRPENGTELPIARSWRQFRAEIAAECERWLRS